MPLILVSPTNSGSRTCDSLAVNEFSLSRGRVVISSQRILLIVVVMSFCLFRSTAKPFPTPFGCRSVTTNNRGVNGVKVIQSLFNGGGSAALKPRICWTARTGSSKGEGRRYFTSGWRWQHVVMSLPRCGGDGNRGSAASSMGGPHCRTKRGDSHKNNHIHIPASRTQSTTSGTSCQQKVEDGEMKHQVFVAVGSNLGNRFENIASAMSLLCDPQFDPNVDDDNEEQNSNKRNARNGAPLVGLPPARLVRTSFLHETSPMYITDQPAFLNGVVEIETDLEPYSLLHRLKNIEAHLGRNFSTVRNGPRTVDLDILLYYEKIRNNAQDKDYTDDTDLLFSPMILDDSPDLIIPHPRIAERSFVLEPLCEVLGPSCHDLRHPTLNVTVGGLLTLLMDQNGNGRTGGDCTEQDGSDNTGSPAAARILPLPRGRRILFNETVIMGIINCTPDSFSDRGVYNDSVELAVNRALEMVSEGAHIVDIGGESTRPGAKEISVDQQIERTIPVITQLRQLSSEMVISIDTRHAEVARAAVDAGADIVNDVSGGLFDPDMLPTVAKLGVPMILMHMRGTPESMQGMTEYDNVVTDVATSLMERSRDAEMAGISRWMQVLDPGIGFAKDMRGNLLLLKHFSTLRSLIGNMPLLLGTSRKGFIGKITGETIPKERDIGTVASCVAAICMGNDGSEGCNILRVHNVKGARQATMVMDAIQKAS